MKVNLGCKYCATTAHPGGKVFTTEGTLDVVSMSRDLHAEPAVMQDLVRVQQKVTRTNMRLYAVLRPSSRKVLTATG